MAPKPPTKRERNHLICIIGTIAEDQGYSIVCSGFAGIDYFDCDSYPVACALVATLRSEAARRPHLFPPDILEQIRP